MDFLGCDIHFGVRLIHGFMLDFESFDWIYEVSREVGFVWTILEATGLVKHQVWDVWNQS